MSIGEQYQEFLGRLKKEHTELSGRIDDLTLFLQRDTSSVISTAHKDMLTWQLHTMKLYHHILNMRLTDLQTGGVTDFKTTRVASEKEVGIDEPIETGGHNEDRDGPVPFNG